MGRTPLEQSIQQLIQQSGLPSDNGDYRKDYLWFANLSSKAFLDETSELSQLMERLCKKTMGTRTRPTDIEAHRRHWQLVLLNLSRAALLNRWVLISRKPQQYSSSYYLKRMKLSLSHMTAIVDFLHERKFIEYREGKKYKKQSLMTRIFPTETLRKKLIVFALEIEEALEPPYIEVREPTEAYAEGVAWDHPEMKDMALINDFLRGHQWACKGPIKLIYKHTPFLSGRLYTAFQGLPSRRIAIRQHTLIDGQPIAEVDYNANHLRINLAVLNGEDAGDTPYEDIGEIAGNISRSQIKSFITIAMGSDSQEKAIKACRLEGITTDLFERIEHACMTRYPALKLFAGFGIAAQNLEGLVLREALKVGVKEDKVMLPIHDAVAVQTINTDWAADVLEQMWIEHVNRAGGKAKPRLKIS